MSGLGVRLSDIARNDEGWLTLSVVISSDGKEDKRAFILSDKKFIELGLKKGVLTEEQFEELERASKECEAYRRGAGILGYGANSEKALTVKLRKRGFDPETAAKAAGELKADGYMDEEADAVREAERGAAKLWGARRIIAHLYEKGYRDEAVEAAKRYLETVDFVTACRKLAEKKMKSNPGLKGDAGKEKLVAALVRYGYGFSEIKTALGGKK